MFAGSLSQIPLGEVCRLLSASNQTGALNLLSPTDTSQHATIYFQTGQIVHAAVDAYGGLDALSEICRYYDANFAFEVGALAPRQTLAVYPTPKLIEKIRQQIEEFQAIQQAMPEPGDIPSYHPGADMSGLEATADELALLLLCNGTRSVSDIARQVNRNPADMARTLAKFRRAGLLDIQRPLPESSSPSASHAPEAGTADAPKDAPRYWRGKLVE